MDEMKHQWKQNGWMDQTKVTLAWILILVSQPSGFNIKHRTLDEFTTQHALMLSPHCTLTTERVVAMELRAAMEPICCEQRLEDSMVYSDTSQGLR